MKKIFKEFKEFALKGSMIDLAIGMIIGSAFTSVVNSLVSNIFNPFIALITGGVDLTNLWKVELAEAVMEGETVVREAVTINFGAFVSTMISFLLTAIVLFILVRGINRLRNLTKKPEAPKAPTTKICPYCKSEIAIDATRCPHCTSELEK